MESYTEADTMYGPLLWTAKWSTGDNIPLGILMPREYQETFGCGDFYKAGLWLFNHEGGGFIVPDGVKEHAGIRLSAYTKAHALAIFRTVIARKITP